MVKPMTTSITGSIRESSRSVRVSTSSSRKSETLFTISSSAPVASPTLTMSIARSVNASDSSSAVWNAAPSRIRGPRAAARPCRNRLVMADVAVSRAAASGRPPCSSVASERQNSDSAKRWRIGPMIGTRSLKRSTIAPRRPPWPTLQAAQTPIAAAASSTRVVGLRSSWDRLSSACVSQGRSRSRAT